MQENPSQASGNQAQGQMQQQRPHTIEKIEGIFLETFNRLKSLGIEGHSLGMVKTKLDEAAVIAKQYVTSNQAKEAA